MRDERGFASLVCICWLAMIMLIGTTVFLLNKSENNTVIRVIYGRKAQLAAEGGVRLLIREIQTNDALRNDILTNQMNNYPKMYAFEDAKSEVYAKRVNSYIVVHGVGTSLDDEDIRARSIAYLKEMNQKYVTDHWEH